MAFPIYFNGQILFVNGLPAFSETCCCDDAYNPCCYEPEFGCRFPNSPVTSLAFTVLGQDDEPFDWVQNGDSYTNADEVTGCLTEIYVPCIGDFKAFNTYYYDEEAVFVFIPDNTKPRTELGGFRISIAGVSINKANSIDPGGECGGPRSFNETGISGGFYLDSIRCNFEG